MGIMAFIIQTYTKLINNQGIEMTAGAHNTEIMVMIDWSARNLIVTLKIHKV